MPIRSTSSATRRPLRRPFELTKPRVLALVVLVVGLVLFTTLMISLALR